MQLEGHDRFGQVPEVGLDGARDRLRLELERVVETAKSWTVLLSKTFSPAKKKTRSARC